MKRGSKVSINGILYTVQEIRGDSASVSRDFDRKSFTVSKDTLLRASRVKLSGEEAIGERKGFFGRRKKEESELEEEEEEDGSGDAVKDIIG